MGSHFDRSKALLDRAHELAQNGGVVPVRDQVWFWLSAAAVSALLSLSMDIRDVTRALRVSREE